MAALLACMAQHLKRIRPMASLGFPASPLGLLCFTAADRATGSSRAAASMGRFCGHAADGLAPPDLAEECRVPWRKRRRRTCPLS